MFHMTTTISNHVGMRYEVACDVIGAVISHHASVIGMEREKDVADQMVIAESLAAQRELDAERDALHLDDEAGIEAAIRKYGPMARAMFG